MAGAGWELAAWARAGEGSEAGAKAAGAEVRQCERAATGRAKAA